ncbi:MAG: hypothetical protein Q7J51_12345 [Sheuella sp.]|nr:hypothetical protein [Sheuella sp.]
MHRFKKIPSTSQISEGFNAHASGAQSITRETARKWLNAKAYPETGRLQVLVDWLHLNPVDILVSSQAQRRIRRTQSRKVPSATSDIYFAQHALDALSAHLAILDSQGNILQVNKAWQVFANDNAAKKKVTAATGLNYLEVCERVTGPESKTAQAMAAGIRSVLNGDITEFALKYPCHSKNKKYWYVARTTRFIADGKAYAVVSHESVSEKNWRELDFPQ